MVDLDSKRQSSEEPQVRVAFTEKTIGYQPCLGTSLKILEMLLDKLYLGRVARICWVIELGHKLVNY